MQQGNEQERLQKAWQLKKRILNSKKKKTKKTIIIDHNNKNKKCITDQEIAEAFRNKEKDLFTEKEEWRDTEEEFQKSIREVKNERKM